MLWEWGHERASLFPLSGLKAQVTACKIKGRSASLPCNSGSGLADLRLKTVIFL